MFFLSPSGLINPLTFLNSEHERGDTVATVKERKKEAGKEEGEVHSQPK